MKSALDFVYWCQQTCTNFHSSSDVFIPPKADIGAVVQPYARIANCLELAGITIPSRYVELMSWLCAESALISTEKAANTRGAILLNKGTVSVSVGDRRRVITEDGYLLTSRHINPALTVQEQFEYGALVPGLEYL